MKISEMNARQKKAFYNVLNAANYIIGGAENTMMDNKPDTREYIDAKDFLNDHAALVETIYNEAVTSVYPGEGGLSFACESVIRDIRFCGKEWIMERVEKRVRKMGY